MTTATPITNIVASQPPRPAYTPSPLHTPRPGVLAPKTLLMGAPGSGKTWAVSTLLAAGLEVFAIITEPNGLPNILNAIKQRNLPLAKFHYVYVPPMSADFSALDEMMRTVSAQSYSSIADMKAGISKNKSTGMMGVLKNLQNFHDERTNADYGDVTSWGYDRALVVDSLSGLNMLAVQLAVGLKPTMHQGEWGVSMNVLETLINKLTSDVKAYFVLLAHIDRGVNEASMQTVVTPSAVGAKLGPKIGRFFSEVVLTKRIDSKFLWSTSEAGADVKQSILPISNALEPSFVPIVRAFEENLKQLGV